jgi:lipopolysaccharide export LptBFGC system permease protein LptF
LQIPASVRSEELIPAFVFNFNNIFSISSGYGLDIKKYQHSRKPFFVVLHFMKIVILIISFCFFSCIQDPKGNKQADVIKTKDNTEDPKLNDAPFTLARIDNRSQRVFVVIDSNIVNDIHKIRAIVKAVNDNNKFKDDLNISFFSNAKYAGFKDEFEDNKGIPNKDFFLSYIGEYNKKTKTYWTYPAAASKKVKYILD